MTKKILVAVADYPDLNGNKAMMFVHTRNLYYVKHDIDVTVLNFAAKNEYVIDGIRVITLNEYVKKYVEYDILVSHSANIRNHYRFLKKYGHRFKRFIFFFHGHEIVRINEVYPPKYEYIGESQLKNKFQDIYDTFKLFIWKHYYPTIALKSEYIFVSEFLYNDFLHYTRIDEERLLGHVHIINNGVGESFQKSKYNYAIEKKYDFITIRSNMDSSVYCVDLLCALAKAMPKKKFLLIGKGHWFEHNIKPDNITWIDETVSHSELLKYIDMSKVAIMLTRRDSQGVMSCELASYGIPLITSNLSICHEMFDKFGNVAMIDNEIDDSLVEQLADKLSKVNQYEENKKFYNENTIKKEIDIIRSV